MRLRSGDLAIAAFLAVLLATFAPRFSAPPLDAHSWRQSLAASVARSYRCGEPFLLPRVDACGPGQAGVQAMELPLYAWAMAKLAVLGPHRGERAVAMLGGVLLLLGLALLARQLLELSGADATALEGGAALAAGACLASYLFLTYGASLLPDGLAYGLAALGAALTLAPPPARGRLAAGSLLLGLAMSTKLVAPPFLALTGTLLFFRVLFTRGARLASLADLALHLALAGALPLAWYLGWTPHLDALSPCRLFWMKLQDPLRQVNAALPGRVHRSLGALLGTGPRLALYVLAVPAVFALRLRAVAVALFWLSCALLWAFLGWHHEVHEYDDLVYLAPAALTAAAGFAWLLARVPPRPRTWLAVLLPVALVAPCYLAVRPELAKREQAEQPALAYLGRDLDLALPPGQGLLAPGAGQDPRISYFAARTTLNSDALACNVPHPDDCGVVWHPGGAICGRGADTLFFPGWSLTCGLSGPRPPPAGRALAPLAARLAAQLHGGGAQVPGLGRFLGWDAASRPHAPARLALFFAAPGGRLDFAKVKLPGTLRRPPNDPPAGALYALECDLPAPDFRFELAGAEILGDTEPAGEVETRCVR